jgi:hypothetical protein
VPWIKAPTVQDPSPSSLSSGPTLSEFARLDRTRAQLEARVPTDSFWSTVLASAFNDPSIVPNDSSFKDWADKKGGKLKLDNVLVTRRDGSELKRLYQYCRASFTVPYNNWSRSGQNDPDSFESFVPRNSGGISALGKRLLVMGTALRIGRPDEVSDLLSFTL